MQKFWQKINNDIGTIAEEKIQRSNEYASYIMDSISNNKTTTVYGNVINNGLIDNLPDNCCVEVPCIIKNNKSYIRIHEIIPNGFADIYGHLKIGDMILELEIHLSYKNKIVSIPSRKTDINAKAKIP